MYWRILERGEERQKERKTEARAYSTVTRFSGRLSKISWTMTEMYNRPKREERSEDTSP